MRMTCPCGSVIVDNTDFLPYKAGLLPDGEAMSLGARLLGLSMALKSALVKGRGRGTATKSIQLLPELERMHQEADALRQVSFRSVYQCPECGRLLVDGPGNSSTYSFVPEDDGTPHDLLRPTRSRADLIREMGALDDPQG